MSLQLVGNGRRIKTALKKTPDRGWGELPINDAHHGLTKHRCAGVIAKMPIKKGAFVSVYSGEVITIAESNSRGDIYDQVGRTCDSSLLLRSTRQSLMSCLFADLFDVSHCRHDDAI